MSKGLLDRKGVPGRNLQEMGAKLYEAKLQRGKNKQRLYIVIHKKHYYVFAF